MCEKTGLTLWINGRKTVTSNKLDIEAETEADIRENIGQIHKPAPAVCTIWMMT